MANSPIADLSYRGYEGGLSPARSRWKVIARQTMRLAFKKRSFWVLSILSGFHYLILAAIAYFMENLGGGMEAGGAAGAAGATLKDQFFGSIIWRDQFLHGFALGHYMLMAIVLLVGAGVIANDNRSKALLVYLSKPCTKVDYLFGKWMGVFVPILVAMAIPAVFFLIYGSLNFREYGFLTEDKLLFLKLPLILVLVSAFQASLVVGISAMFQQGRIAGTAYAGLYVMSGLFGLMPNIALQNNVSDAARTVLERFHYCSIYGVIEGVYKLIFNTSGSARLGDGPEEIIFPIPPAGMIIALYIIPVALCLWLAWKKIRAVEVVE